MLRTSNEEAWAVACKLAWGAAVQAGVTNSKADQRQRQRPIWSRESGTSGHWEPARLRRPARRRCRGHLPFSSSGGVLLFHLLSKLYERTSVVITMNLSFGEGPASLATPRWPRPYWTGSRTTAISPWNRQRELPVQNQLCTTHVEGARAVTDSL